jgi:hypothetical protein
MSQIVPYISRNHNDKTKMLISERLHVGIKQQNVMFIQRDIRVSCYEECL